MADTSETSGHSPVKKSRFRWIPWILVPLMFIIYASNPTRRFYFDGVVFASIIEHGPFEALFNPHHLLYTGFFSMLENLIESILGRPVYGLEVMQWGNIIVGSILVGLMWRIISRLVADRVLALMVTLMGCFSITYWHYTTDADVYMISTAFLFLAADRLEIAMRQRTPRTGDFIWIGIFHAFSILFHQLNVFWTICMITCLWTGIIPGNKRERWRWWWTYALSLSIPVAVAYLGIGIFVLGHTTPETFMFWITEYGHESVYWYTNPKDIAYLTVNGYLMVFFHRYSILDSVLQYNLAQAVEEGRFWQGFIKQVFGYYALGLLFFCYIAGLYNLKKYFKQYPKMAVMLVSWLAPYVLFQFFFMPTNAFYKLFILIPILTIFAWYGQIVVSKEKKWFKYAVYGIFVAFTALLLPVLAVLVALFIIVFELFQDRKHMVYRYGLFILVIFLPFYNYIYGIMPESKLDNNPEVVHALKLAHQVEQGDLVIFEGGYDYPNGWIISALTDAERITLAELGQMESVERSEFINSVTGNIYIHPNIACGEIRFYEEDFEFPDDETKPNKEPDFRMSMNLLLTASDEELDSLGDLIDEYEGRFYIEPQVTKHEGTIEERNSRLVIIMNEIIDLAETFDFTPAFEVDGKQYYRMVVTE